MEDLFSESKPDLINKKTLYNFQKQLKKPVITQPVEEIQWSDGFSSFYKNYIEPNILFIIVVIILALFLLYKYFTKSTDSDDSEEKEYFSKSKKKKNKKKYIINSIVPNETISDIIPDVMFNQEEDPYYGYDNLNQNIFELQNYSYIENNPNGNKRNIDKIAELIFPTNNTDYNSNLQFNYNENYYNI